MNTANPKRQRKLTQDARSFVRFQVMFSGMSAILTLFVNTFLLSAFGSYSLQVLLYNIILAAVQPAAMILASHVISA